MKESMMQKEQDAEIEMGLLFKELDGALREGELVLNISNAYDTYHWFKTGKEVQDVRIYQFGNGISIAQEKYLERGNESVRVSGYPECEYENSPYTNNRTFYFVYQEGKPVTDEEQARSLIRQATGVKLLGLKTSLPMMYSFLDYREVVTDFGDVGNNQSPPSFEDFQPSRRRIAKELKKMLTRIDSLKDEFLVENADQGLKDLRATVSQLY